MDTFRQSFYAVSFLFAAFYITVTPALAQEKGSVSGTVKEVGHSIGLEGVSIYLENTVIGVTTSFNGSFLLDRVDPGNYVLVARLIGFGSQKKEITIEAGKAAVVDFELEEQSINLEEVVATGERTFSAASSMTVGGFDLRTRPIQSSQDLLQLAPGLVVAQHAGGGKAEQIFMRGFDADHGTDVSINVDGIPVNMVSHGHGQGYADLHFVIPDVIDQLVVRKGPYFAGVGNLGTAGSITFKTRDHFEDNLIRVEAGSYSLRKFTTVYQIPLPGQHQGAYMAGQFFANDGPFKSPQGFKRANLFGKFHTHLTENAKLSVSVGGFSSAWDASGQIPERAIENGSISRFGYIDDREGGTTGRQNVNMIYQVHSQDNRELKLQAYTSRYNFKLFSNFTFFLDNPEFGDMIEQTDDRSLYGFNGTYRFSTPMGRGIATSTMGGGFRSDDIDVSLWQSPNRIRDRQLVSASIRERNASFWFQEDLLFGPSFSLQLGLRADYFTFNVEDPLELDPDSNPLGSGYAQETIINPKVNAVFTPLSSVDIFLNFGTGFHSNDARSIVFASRLNDVARTLDSGGLSKAEIETRLDALNYRDVDLEAKNLPRAIGAEIGTRLRVNSLILLSMAAWWMDLEGEYVYVGDGGFTELSGPSRRLGMDMEVRAQLQPWIWTDLEISASQGRLVDEPDGADHIPLAPRLTAVGGVSVRHSSNIEGSLRFRYIGDRPANEVDTVTAQGHTVVDFVGSYTYRRFQVNFSIQNVFDVEWNEAQFDTESRLFEETESVGELHFTPGSPRTLRVGVGYTF